MIRERANCTIHPIPNKTNQEDPIDGALYGANRRNGYIRCMGEVAAFVFVHPDQQIEDLDRFLKCDLLRSISGRLRLFLDAYPDLPDDQRLVPLCRIQPPRRVFFWPFLGERIQFCDYLFEKEDAQVTALNARDVFGVAIEPHMVNQTREKSKFSHNDSPCVFMNILCPIHSSVRLPTNHAYTIDPEMPKLYTKVMRRVHVMFNVFFVLALLVGLGALAFVAIFGTKYAENSIQ